MRDLGRPVSRATRALAAVVLVPAAFGLLPAIPAAAATGIREVGRFPVLGGPERAATFLDAGARRLYQIFYVAPTETPAENDRDQVRRAPGVHVQMRDLDGLKVLKDVVVGPSPAVRPGNLVIDALVDEKGHRLFVPVQDQNGDDARSVEATLTRRFVVVDGRSLRISGTYEIQPPMGVRGLTTLAGMAYDPRQDRIDLLWQVSPSPILAIAGQTVVLSQIAAKDGASMWSYVVPGCNKIPVFSAARFPIGHSLREPVIYFACLRVVGVPVASYNPGQPLGVRVNLDRDGKPAGVEQIAVSGAVQTSAIDPERDLLYILSPQPGTLGAWVIDVRHRVVLGIASTAPASAKSGASDAATGRFYMATADEINPFGLVSIDAGTQPLPQPDRFTNVRRLTAASMTVDPSTQRILVMQRTENERMGTVEYDWVVFRDERSLVSAPEADPDSNTVDVPEQAGVTDTLYSGAASGFGARLLVPGGLNGAERNLFPDLIFGTIPTLLQGGAPDVHLGRIESTLLSQDEASSHAIGAQRDGNTETNRHTLTHPRVQDREINERCEGEGSTRTCSEIVDVQWPYVPAECRVFGAPNDIPSASRPGSSVTCSRTSVEARAFGDGALIPEQPELPAIRIGRAWATTSIVRDRVRGIVATAHSVATDVTVGDLVSIARIESTAETWARGRRGTAGGRFVRTIEGARISSGDGTVVYSCSSKETCDPADVIGAANLALGPRIHLSLPRPDGRFSGGTPGGFQAVVQRDPWEHLQEVAMNDEDRSRVEVPALELIADLAHSTRLRAVLQLAAVEADAHYGIYLLPPQANEPAPPSLVGTVVETLPPPVAPPAKAAPVARTETVLKRFARGLAYVLLQPGDIALVAAMWVLLGAPLAVAVRRRRLRRSAA